MSLQTACTAIAHSYSTLSTIKYHIKRRRTSSLVSFLHCYRFKAKSNMYYIPPKRVAVLPPNPLLMSSRGCSVTLGTVRLAMVNNSYSPSWQSRTTATVRLDNGEQQGQSVLTIVNKSESPSCNGEQQRQSVLTIVNNSDSPSCDGEQQRQSVLTMVNNSDSPIL